jgi:hypothetical protein
MIYATLVGDGNPKAYQWLTDHYNFAVYPTTFFDGGHGVHVDIPEDSSEYWIPIQAAGERSVPDLEIITALDHLGGTDYQIHIRVTNGLDANGTPQCPEAPVGPDAVPPSQAFAMSGLAQDPNHDDTYYQFDWDDGDSSDWLGPYPHGDSVLVYHAYSFSGTMTVRFRPRDVYGAIGEWSPQHSIAVAPTCCFVPGDINDDTIGPDIADLIYLVTYMFQGGPNPDCMIVADINGDSVGPDIADLIYLVTFMFQGGPDLADCPI